MSEDYEEPDKEKLITETARYLSAYIGEIEGIRSFADSLEPKLQVNGITELLEYHFLRTGHIDGDGSDLPGLGFNQSGQISYSDSSFGILDFASALPDRLRSVNPASHKEEQVLRGAVTGSVDWGQTHKHRMGSMTDTSRDFVCKVPARSHITPANRTVVELLTTIKDIYERFDECIEDEDADRPGWFDMWEPGSSARGNIESALSNVYLEDFATDSNRVSDRELREVQEDREPLYSEAAGLLSAYRKISGREIEEVFAKTLLRSDVFKPVEDDDSLFELYWLFKIVDSFENSRLEQIRDSNRGRLVAKWGDTESEYLLFNDWNGRYTPAPGEDSRQLLNFRPPEYDFGGDVDEDAGDSTRRRAYVIRYSQLIRQEALKYTPAHQYPDIVVLECGIDSGKLRRVLVGEVKHSIEKGYLRDNAQQLVEYGMFAKSGEDIELPERDVDSNFVASNANLAEAPEIELGYFVGHTNAINEFEDDGIKVYGFGDEPNFSFITSDDG